GGHVGRAGVGAGPAEGQGARAELIEPGGAGQDDVEVLGRRGGGGEDAAALGRDGATAEDVLAGTSRLDKFGAGTLTLGRASTYSGPTNVAAGVLNLTGSIANSDLNVTAAGTLSGEGAAKSATFASNSVLVVDPVTAGAFATTGALTVNATSASKMTINLTSGPANLDPFTVATYGSTNATPDLFSVTGASSYRGTPTIVVGDTALTLQLGFGQLTWTGAVNGTFDNATNNFLVGPTADKFIYGDVVTFDDTSAVNTVTLAGNLTPTLVNFINSAQPYTLVSSTGNTLTGYTKVVKSGTGALVFAGTANNTYTGGTVLSQGSLQFTNLGGAGTGALTIGDANSGAGDLSVMITARPAAGNYLTAPIVVAAGTTGAVTIGTTAGVTGVGALGFNGIVLNRDVTFLSDGADRTEYSGITGTGNVTFAGSTRATVGTVAANTFVGDVTVTSTAANALQVGVATAAALNGIPDTALVTLGAGSTLAMSATSETIGNLAGTGTVTTNSFAGTLSIGGKNADATFAGLLTEQTGFALSIAKVGSGKLTLTNVANAFTGNLTITGGTLELAGTAKVFAPAYNNTSVVTIGAGARLVVDELGYGGNLGQLADYSARRVLAGGTLEVRGNNGGLGIGQGFTANAGAASTFLYNPT
ncbi:MAG: hypothetical protein EBS87_11720, partial [Sphingomonadaceae bacterium]|nr:hypothetical protein [Sphingomonadaceae bacterium]